MGEKRKKQTGDLWGRREAEREQGFADTGKKGKQTERAIEK